MHDPVAVPRRCGTVHLRLAFVALPLVASGCSWFWPTIVRDDPADQVFRSGLPLVGPARTDGALCSLATAGPDTNEIAGHAEPLDAAVPLDDWCATAEPARPGQRGRLGRLVEVDGKLGRVHGYLFAAPAARGLLVAFSGLGMPASGWVNERFAELAARRGWATFAPVRDESARPIAFDPLREARRALGGALRIRERCGIREPFLAFVGMSMGGLEALLANREARAASLETRVAVLDPLLDPPAVTDNLDSFWHSLATDSMQAYFHRILRGRYGEPASTTFRELLNRSRADPQTRPDDSPPAWLCKADPRAYAVFLSDGDPVLGSAQADFARHCKFPLRSAKVKGHVGVACRLELFDEMLDAVGRPAPPVARAVAGSRRRSRA